MCSEKDNTSLQFVYSNSMVSTYNGHCAKTSRKKRDKVGTIDEIARAAQVSKSTVSNVLNGRTNVSEKLRKRVLDASKALNVSMNSGSLKQEPKESKVISVTLNIEDERSFSSFNQNLLQGVLSVCNKNNYYLLIKNDSLKNRQQDQFPIDGEIILNPEKDSLFYGAVPHVWIGTPPLKERERIPYVDNDNELIGYSVTEYLIERGHERIAFINSQSTKTVSHSRKHGYEQALIDYRLDGKSNLHFFLQSEENYYEEVYDKTIELLNDRRPMDAMIVNSDLMAQAVYQACEDMRFKVPQDVSVIAIYADGQSNESFEPSLTTVQLNEAQLGVEACKLLLSIIGYEKTSGGGAIVPTSIIEKESVRKN